MGVIPNQVLKKWHRMGCFPVMGGVILSKIKSQKNISHSCFPVMGAIFYSKEV